MRGYKDFFILVIWLSLFCLLFWFVNRASENFTILGDSTLQRKISTYVSVAILMSVPYFLLLRRRKLKVSPLISSALVFLACLATPTTLQTDQIRYIWDGLVSLLGENPYLLAPDAHPAFSVFPAQSFLNHPQLHTIYPPVAQWFFALSVLLNPPLWNGYLGWLWAPEVQVPSGFLLEIGWKATVGLCAGALVYTMRHRRWDLFILHPLVLMTWIGNGHVDADLALFLALLFETGKAHAKLRQSNRWAAQAL